MTLYVKLGAIVSYRAVKKQNEDHGVDYPAIVYKIHADGRLGLVVFNEGIPHRIAVVSYSEEPKEECWSTIYNTAEIEVSSEVKTNEMS